MDYTKIAIRYNNKEEFDKALAFLKAKTGLKLNENLKEYKKDIYKFLFIDPLDSIINSYGEAYFGRGLYTEYTLPELLNNHNIDYRIDRWGSTLIFQVLWLKDKPTERLTELFVSSEGIKVKSSNNPDIGQSDFIIYVGNGEDFGKVSTCRFENEEQAKMYMEEIIKVLEEWNSEPTILEIEYKHNEEVLYRDYKLVVDDKGNIRVENPEGHLFVLSPKGLGKENFIRIFNILCDTYNVPFKILEVK